jgi:hypothetical protein
MTALVLDPLLPAWAWLGLASSVLASLVWYARRGRTGKPIGSWCATIGLMAAGAILPLLILLNPTWEKREPPPAGKPHLTIAIDSSASMATTDMPNGVRRFAEAATFAEQCRARLADRFDVSLAVFAQHAAAIDSERLSTLIPDGSATNLASVIRDTAGNASGPGRSLLLLSDGNHNAHGGVPDLLAAVAQARAADITIHTRTLGTDAAIDDLALRMVSPRQLAFAGQSVPVSVRVRRRGKTPDRVDVVLTRDDKEVAREPVELFGEKESEARFSLSASEPGLFRYEARVESFGGEATAVNNHAAFLLRVVDEPIRVLLVEGKPYWDTKFLVRELMADRSVESTSIVRLAENRYLKRDWRRLPSTADRSADAATPREFEESSEIIRSATDLLAKPELLASFQVLILGRDTESFLSDEALVRLRQWVSAESGALVCFRGQPTTRVSEPLERLLPVQWGMAREARFRVQLTERGQALRWFDSEEGAADSLPQLPPLVMPSTVQAAKPLATVLASAEQDGTAAVSYQQYGAGRVVVIEGAGMWRWAFLPPAFADHDQTYHAFWQSLTRWLVSGIGLLPGQDHVLQADKLSFSSQEIASATLMIRPQALGQGVPMLELTGETLAQPRLITPHAAGDGPGVFCAEFGSLGEGQYRVRMLGLPRGDRAATVFDVRDLREEQLDLQPRPDLMARIAASTGGAALNSSDIEEFVSTFAAQAARSRPERIRRVPAWDRGWVLGLVFLTWTVTWGFRRMGGLV